MSYISLFHRRISEYAHNPEIIDDPEKYFGPNYKILLNFWIYLERIGPEKLGKYQDYLMRMGTNEWTLGYSNICTAEECMSQYYLPDLKYYEREIIAAHVLIDLGKPLKFILLLETYEQPDSL
jgi:hypothetical protein